MTQWGITWTFDKTYTTGQYANGDWWVLGPVKLTSISPDFTGTRNGWEVNPVVSGAQGFDNRVDPYGGAPFDPALVPALPYTAAPGQSIVKAVSAPAAGTYSALQKVAVLTVVGAIPANDGATVFRPPYVGTAKPTYLTTSLRTELLPTYPRPAQAKSLAWVYSKYRMVQCEHKDPAASIRPFDNYIVTEFSTSRDTYGGYIGRDLSEAALALMLDDPIAGKMPALIAYVQGGIDRFHMMQLGHRWGFGEGYSPNMKMPLYFMAAMFQDAGLTAAVRALPQAATEAAELYRNKDGVVLFGDTDYSGDPEEKYWGNVANQGVGNYEYRDPYQLVDGGYAGDGGDPYQVGVLSQPWKGQALAVQIMPALRGVYDFDMLLDYADRWVNVGLWTQPDTVAPCLPGGIYGVTYGPDRVTGQLIRDTNPGDGIGRFPTQHGANKDGGYYRGDTADAMWPLYRDAVNSSDTTPPSSPGGLTAAAISGTQVALAWTASTDNSGGSGMAGYRIYRNGSLVGSSSVNSFTDGILAPQTAYSYTVAAIDRVGNLSPASIAVSATTQANHAPAANAQSVVVSAGMPMTITLSAADADAGDVCTFAKAALPQHGTLGAISGAQVVYTPASGYAGSDSFSFTATDSHGAFSAAAVVNLSVSNTESIWSATTAPYVTDDGTAYELGTVFSPTVAGRVLAIRVFLASGESGQHTARLWDNAANAVIGGPWTMTLSGSGWTTWTLPNPVEVAAGIRYTVAVSTGTDAARTYTALPGALAAASGNDAHLTCPAHAGVYTTVLGTRPTSIFQSCNYLRDIVFSAGTAPVNRPPVAMAQSVAVNEDTATPIALAAIDADGDALTWSIATKPAHGTLTGAPPALSYKPAANWNGTDSFTIIASDGQAASGPATVTISVAPVNDRPSARAQGVGMLRDATAAFTLAGYDVEGSPLTYAIVRQPLHGSLGGTVAARTYTPAAGFVGTDSCTFTVQDGSLTSVAATVVFTVTASFAAQVNFQPESVPLPAGCLKDQGLPFAARNGQAYGWNLDLSAAANLRDRNNAGSPDQQHDTFLQLGPTGQQAATWEMAVPDGLYFVTVVMGDPLDTQMPDAYRCTLEGVPAIDGIATATQNWLETTQTVIVTDGRLSLGFAGGAGVQNKVCSIVISAVPAGNG